MSALTDFNSFLNEKLGVPEGIVEQAVSVKQEMVQATKQLPTTLFDEMESNPQDRTLWLFTKDISFAGVTVTKVDFVLDLQFSDRVHRPIYFEAFYSFEPSVIEPKGKGFVTTTSQADHSIGVSFAVPPGFSQEQLVRELEQVSVPILAHELLHLYEVAKKGEEQIINRSKYFATSQSFPVQAAVEILRLMYYMDRIEQMTRATEVYSELLEKGVTKANFKQAMRDSKVMKAIQVARDFSLDQAMKKIEQDPISKTMQAQAIRSGFQTTGSLALDVLTFMFSSYAKASLGLVKSVLQQWVEEEPTERAADQLGLPERPSYSKTKRERIAQAVQFINGLAEEYAKHQDNPIKFFRQVEKDLNREGELLWRKLHKLWDLLPATANESIVNWEVYDLLHPAPLWSPDYLKIRRFD